MKNILRRISLWQKFAFLGLIAAVIATIPLFQVVTYKNAELAVAQAEDAGLDPVRTLVSLQKNLQAHRGLAAMVLSGNTAVDTERRARQADVNTQFAALDKQLTTLGYTKAADPAKAMKTGWDQLSQKVDARAINAKDSFEAHTALVEQNIAVIEMVADASGLSLDPVAESYYVMTAVVDHLPRLAEAIEVLHTGGIDALTSKDATPTTRANLIHMSHAVHVAQGRSINQLTKAGEIDVGVAKALEASAKAAEKTADALHETGEDIAASGGATVDAATFAKLGQSASDAQYLAMAAATEVLEKLLHDRIAATSDARTVLLAEMGVLMLLAAGLAFAIVRSVTRPLAQAVDAANAVADGDLSYRIDTSGSDEAAQLLKRFAQMQTNLQQRQQEDAARMAETAAQAEAAQQVAGEIGDAVDAANQGDFSRRIATGDKDAFHAGLCNKFNELVETVSKTIREVRVAADHLGAASAQVSQTSQSLSQGASQQAASVEETTASLQEIAASVKQNADSATVTDGIATKAAEAGHGRWRRPSAQDGGGDEVHRHQDLHHRRHRLPDQPAGAERRHRGRTRRRTRQGLRRGGRRGAQAGRAQPGRGAGDRQPGHQLGPAGRRCRHAAGRHGAVDPEDRRTGAGDRRCQWRAERRRGPDHRRDEPPVVVGPADRQCIRRALGHRRGTVGPGRTAAGVDGLLPASGRR